MVKGKSHIIRRRESLVLYKSFNTLWGRGKIANWRTTFGMSLPQAILKCQRARIIFCKYVWENFPPKKRHPKRSQAKNLCALKVFFAQEFCGNPRLFWGSDTSVSSVCLNIEYLRIKLWSARLLLPPWLTSIYYYALQRHNTENS